MLPAQHTKIEIGNQVYDVAAADENGGVCLLAEDAGAEEVRLVVVGVVVPVPIGTYPTIEL